MKSYRTECPKCMGHNFVITPDNGIGYCYNCAYFNNGKHTIDKIETSEHVDAFRELYKQATNYYHSSLTPDAYSFLVSRGFNDTVITDLKIGFCPTGKHPLYKHKLAKEAGLIDHNNSGFLANRVTFPYFANGSITEIRGRAIESTDEIKYKSLLGSSIYRGAIYPYNYHLSNNKRIVITEGEIKAAIAYQVGTPAMALPGMGIWRAGFKPNKDTEYILLFDSQRYGMKYVKQAITKIAQKIKHIKIATLPLMGKDKQDIDSFILSYGASAFHTIINSALTYNDWRDIQRF